MKKNSNSIKKLIAPSILSADFSRLGEEVSAVEKAGADWIHVDVMDGHFVPNLTIGPVVVEGLSKKSKVPLDVHLMITDPDTYAPEFAKAGATSITIHQEATKDLLASIKKIRALGVRVGVSISPDTPVKKIENILSKVDLVLVMSVHPGFGGQKFIPASLEKVKKLNQIRKKNGLHFLIEIDGGINADTITSASTAGCDVFVAGSAIFKSKNYKKTIQELRKKL